MGGVRGVARAPLFYLLPKHHRQVRGKRGTDLFIGGIAGSVNAGLVAGLLGQVFRELAADDQVHRTSALAGPLRGLQRACQRAWSGATTCYSLRWFTS